MTIEPGDDLIRQLQTADPVDPTTLPSANDQAANILFDAILAEADVADSADLTGEAIDVDGAQTAGVFATLPEINRTRNRGRRQHWAVLAGAAAAVMILVSGLATFLPDNTPSALAAVHSAAAATADADSGQVTVTFWLDGSADSVSERVVGDINATFNGADLAMALELADQPSTFAGELPSSVETRLVGGKLYLNDGSQWYVIEAPAGLAATLIEFVDPRSVLNRIEELLETEEIGSTTTDGVATTHYRSIVDLGSESLGDAQWLPFDTADIKAEGEVTVDLFVDQEGLLRQFILSGEIHEPQGDGAGNGEARFEIVTSFSNLGADVAIEAPANAVPFDQAAPGFGFGFGD